MRIKDNEMMKALQRFRNWVGNLFGKKIDETPSTPEKPRTPLDEFIEVYSRLNDFPYFSGPFDKRTNVALAVAKFKLLISDIGGKIIGDGSFTLANNTPVDLDAVDGEEDISPEPVPTELYCGKFGWAEGEAEEHPAMLELAKKRAEEGWINPHIVANSELASAKSKKPAKKKTKKAAKTRKKGKASK
jgi:hypothetical protein